MSTFWPITFKGLHAFCTAYAAHEQGTVMLSLVGSVTVLNGLWAAFLSHETLVLNEEIAVRRLLKPEDQVPIKTLAHKRASEYRTLSARLRDTGKRQLVIVHQQATQACELDCTFFVLQEQTGPLLLARFYAQFTRAVVVCARPNWSEYLWQQGLAAQLVTPCETLGPQAWCVSPDADAWAGMVQVGLQAKRIE